MDYSAAFGGLAGHGSKKSTYEAEIGWGKVELGIVMSGLISGTARDSGNADGGTKLRPGLLLGRITSSKKWVHWDPTATNGSDVVQGVLLGDLRVTDEDGNNKDRNGPILVAGPVKGAKLIVPGDAAAGGITQLARSQMYGRFLIDDELAGNRFSFLRVVAKTADYTVTIADHDTVFTNRGAAGAVNFTLPVLATAADKAKAKGCRYRFVCEADQTITITGGTADTLVVYNDAAADSVALSTASNKIGGAFEVFANDDGSKWIVLFHPGQTSDGTATGQRVTITT